VGYAGPPPPPPPPPPLITSAKRYALLLVLSRSRDTLMVNWNCRVLPDSQRPELSMPDCIGAPLVERRPSMRGCSAGSLSPPRRGWAGGVLLRESRGLHSLEDQNLPVQLHRICMPVASYDVDMQP
jgi:hypothetical protein